MAGLIQPRGEETQMGADVSQMGAEFDLDDPIGSALAAREDFPFKPLTEKKIGAAFEVHKQLGSGFLEKVYENAMVRELVDRGLRIETQHAIAVSYKGHLVGSYFADILVENSVICEIKAIETLLPSHETQILHYLKATGTPVGLLLNVGSPRVQVKRKVRTQ
jgi:GxxExxY protein